MTRSIFSPDRPAATLALAAAAILVAGPAGAADRREAVFAGGCYWTMEHDMEPLPGVMNVIAGFVPFTAADTPAGLPAKAPRAYEAVKVAYDASKITYAQLTARYLRLTDPTDSGGAFCDRGPNYRPVIFYGDESERAAAQAAIAAAQPMVRKKILTAVLPRREFRAAPTDQQDWARKNPDRYGRYREGCGKDRVLAAIWTTPGA
jgi:peptide-methionine (S)-S-oxide reductase